MAPKKPSAVEFALTGTMGRVEPGMPFAQVERVWGSPTAYRLTRPPSRWYGPVAVFVELGLRPGGVVTHLGIYFEEADACASPIELDLSPATAADQFRERIVEAGGECEVASDLMDEEDTVMILRVVGSGVVAIFDERDRMTCLSSEERHPLVL